MPQWFLLGKKKKNKNKLMLNWRFILNENLLQNKAGVANYCLTYCLGSVNEF